MSRGPTKRDIQILPPFATWADLQAYLRVRHLELNNALDATSGPLARQTLLGRISTAVEVLAIVEPLVEAEAAISAALDVPDKPSDLERDEAAADAEHEARVAEAYTRAYGSDPLAPWQAEGR